MKIVVSLMLVLVVIFGCVGLIACGCEEEEETPPDSAGAPAPSDGGAPAPSDGGAPAPSDGGAPAPSDGGTPAPSEAETQPPDNTEAGLAAYYPFDGDTDDYSGNGNHATNYGATFVAGKYDQALSFDGKDDYVSAPVNINPEAMPQVTLAVWVRTNKASPIQTVISHDDGYYDRAIVIDRRGGGTGWSAFSGDGGVLGYHPSQVGQWTFIAAVYDQDNGTVKLFVDGSIYDGNGICTTGWDYIHIGENPAFAEFFSGEIDEVKIYDYALSADELRSLHETGLAQPGAAPATGDGAPAGDQDGEPVGGEGNGGTNGETLEEILARGADIPPVKYDQLLAVSGEPTIKWTVWAEGSRFRVEVPMEGQTMIQLIDLDNELMYMYNPAENMAMEMDLSGFEGIATEASAGILDYHPTVIGTETLDGMVCQVVAYTYTDPQGGEVKVKQWLWKERGLPIRVETTSQGRTSVMEMKNIEFGDIPDEMFELPDGVEIMEFGFSDMIPEMPE
jgi:hypothetical protein